MKFWRVRNAEKIIDWKKWRLDFINATASLFQKNVPTVVTKPDFPLEIHGCYLKEIVKNVAFRSKPPILRIGKKPSIAKNAIWRRYTKCYN